MISQGGLSSDCDIAADFRAAANSSKGHDKRFLPDLHIVSYLNKVVDFRAPSDDRVLECRTVDGHIGANLHVIFYNYPSDLGYLVMLTFFERRIRIRLILLLCQNE